MTPPKRQGTVDGPVACYYADDPVRRPRCTLTAVVRYGAMALCPACQTQRSTVGKGTTPVKLPSPATLDVLARIDAAHEQLTAAERSLAGAVTRARQSGCPWSAIGTRLGLTRQATQQRFASPSTRASTHESTKPATRAP